MFPAARGDGPRDALPWDAIHLWWGDERCVPPEHADSTNGMTKCGFDRSPLRLTNLHRNRRRTDAKACAEGVLGAVF